MSSTRALLISAIVLLISVCLTAQDSAIGAIRGTVMDSSGGRIAQASVVIVNTATGAPGAATADSQGRFAIEMLPPGDYSLRFEAQGMSPEVTPQLHVSVGGIAELEFPLHVAGEQEQITVSAEPSAGIRGFQNSFLVDGGDNNNAFYAQTRGRYREPYGLSTDTVQEFRVSTNSYSAELSAPVAP